MPVAAAEQVSEAPLVVIVTGATWAICEPVVSNKFKVTEVPLMSPLIVALVRYGQKWGVPVAVRVPVSVALLEPVFGPCVSDPVTLKVSGATPDDAVDTNVP